MTEIVNSSDGQASDFAADWGASQFPGGSTLGGPTLAPGGGTVTQTFALPENSTDIPLGGSGPLAPLKSRRRWNPEVGPLARAFPDPNLRVALRRDLVVRVVLESCLQEMERVLEAADTPYVVKAGMRVDSEEWITGGAKVAKYTLLVRTPALGIQDRLKLWRELSEALPLGKATAIDRLARPPRIHGVDVWNNVMIHFDLR